MDAVSDPLYQRLFRLFCWLSEGGVGVSPGQAAFLIEESVRVAGRPSTSKHFAFNEELVSFRELLGLIENIFPDRKQLETTTQAVFERYIDQILVKGFVLYRRQRHSSFSCASWRNGWTNGWCCVQPGQLHVARVQNGKLRSKISISLQHLQLQGPIYEDGRYVVSLNNKDEVREEYEFAYVDSQSCSELVTGISLAQQYHSKESLLMFDRRNAFKFQGRDPDAEEDRRRRLEQEKAHLERQLEEGRQALKDEEIVRGLATRMLEEERLKSEQMERVLQELQKRLHDGNGDVGEDEEVEEIMQSPSQESQPLLEASLETSNSQLGQADPEEGEVWQKEDYLIMSTQSI